MNSKVQGSKGVINACGRIVICIATGEWGKTEIAYNSWEHERCSSICGAARLSVFKMCKTSPQRVILLLQLLLSMLHIYVSYQGLHIALKNGFLVFIPMYVKTPKIYIRTKESCNPKGLG